MLKVGLWLRSSVAAVICLLFVTGCASDGTNVPEIIALSPFASSGAPISTSNHIAILPEGIACVIDSFEERIHCVERADGNVAVFGGEGGGPGEFTALSSIHRGRDGHIVAVDFGKDRLSFFRPNGILVSETRMPSSFVPTRLRDDRLFGFELGMPDFVEEFELSFVPMEVDASSGEILWQGTDLANVVGRECFNPAVGASMPDGGLVFEVCEYELAFFDHRDAPRATVVASPSYVEALPNERDVAAHLDDIVGIRSLAGPVPESEIDAIAAEFREEPKEWLLGTGFGFDDENRLWVSTTRDRDEFSYFDVWADTTYVGAVRVQDRLMGFDIFGSTLVTLVERALDEDGAGERGIDWYDLSEID